MKKYKKVKSKIKKNVIGKVDYNIKGFGFLIGEFPDTYIPRKYMNDAFEGDTVRANIVDGEARVVEILERGVKEISGVIYSTYSNKGIIKSTNKYPDFLVKDMAGAKDGDVVVAKITNYSSCTAVIKEILGQWDDVIVRAKAAQASFGVTDMPSDVEKFASNLCVTEQMLNGRKDYRDSLVITIDGEDSKDFDDGVALKKSGDVFELFVHIADVAEFVKANDKIDKEAFKRGTSCYFAGLVVPMLPKKLSDDICSLKQGEDRLTLSVEIKIDSSGEILDAKIFEGVIRSKARMTYGQVNKILEGKQQFDSDITDMLFVMKELATILKAKRIKNGEIEFDIPECEFDIQNGRVTDVRKKNRLISHQIIEQFMVTANEAVADIMTKVGSPFIYRVHTSPPSEKMHTLSQFLKATGYGILPDNPKSIDVANLLKNSPDSVKELVSKVTLKSMAKASYEVKNEGHFGLASQCYCHFTSPIRRYPDLAIHRIIKDYLKNGENIFDKYNNFCVSAAKTGSERERNAEMLERKVDDIIKADYMQDKIGNNYQGVISGVIERGIFVELDNTVEGMIKIENLPGYYSYDEVKMRLYSASKTYSIGDKINITVYSVTEDKIEFVLQKEDKNSCEQKSNTKASNAPKKQNRRKIQK